MKELRVLVADDQEMVRIGLSAILETFDDISVVAHAADGREAVRRALEHRVDVCLMDIRMPGMDGIEATQLLAGPGSTDPVPVVIVTTFDEDSYVREAIQAGARGFLLKDADPALLAEGVRAAARGDALMAPAITGRLLADVVREGPRTLADPLEPLTDREEAVLLLVARGRTNGEVAEELFVAVSTVKTHVGAIMAKLGVRNRVEIALFAYESGRLT